ncbi:MAG: polyamine aminopropyltransferase [Eggerthellaceae bacterium]|nr:polyamine aminopropyltransferase [Eggerthellaceae bacterium]
MDLWFSEYHTDQTKFSTKITRQLFSEQTDYQQIDIFDSIDLGRFLSSDGKIVLTEKDGYIYEEMIVHVPMAVHPKVKNVLIIGGGDGGVVKLLLNYDEIKRIDVTEPDERFIEVCRTYFPDSALSLDDKRVHLFNVDGLKFLRSRSNEYDLIINDANDPLGHRAGLFTREFYGNCYRALKDDGVMVYQHGSPWYEEGEDSFRLMHNKACHSFPISRVYQAHIPSCPAGYWMFGFTSKKYHPIRDFDKDRWKKRGLATRYYTTNLHKSSFMLPKYVEDILREEEGKQAAS